jgi:hypothetical protein
MAMADLARRSTYDDIDPQDAAAYRMQRKYLGRNVAGSAPADNSAIPGSSAAASPRSSATLRLSAALRSAVSDLSSATPRRSGRRVTVLI